MLGGKIIRSAHFCGRKIVLLFEVRLKKKKTKRKRRRKCQFDVDVIRAIFRCSVGKIGKSLAFYSDSVVDILFEVDEAEVVRAREMEY